MSIVAGRTPADAERPSIRELLRFFLNLGATGFGGPIALVGQMEREFVDRRQWATSQELKDGLAFSQLAPGPLAAQLAIYLGWLCRGTRGATIAGIAFVAPSFLMVLAIGAAYVRFGGMTWLEGAFYGIGAAVIAIISRSALKLTRTTLGSDRLLWALFVVSAGATAWTESELVWVLVLCGLVSMLTKYPPSVPSGMRSTIVPTISALRVEPWLSALADPTHAPSAAALFIYFASAGMFVFGSGLAIVPFLHGGVVVQHAWLTERQFLDAVAVALITPGPVVITVAFIGYLVDGLAGATAAAAGVFAPVYVLTILVAPHYQRLKSQPRIRAFVDGVTAAATGAIAGAVVVLGRRALIDPTTVTIAAVALIVMTRRRRIPEPVVILAAGIVGVLTRTPVP